MRYFLFAPEILNTDRTRWLKGERKLYVRRGYGGLEIYYYLQFRESANDTAILKYYQRTPAQRERALIQNREWHRANRDKCADSVAAANERKQHRLETGDEYREHINDYMRDYLPGYYARNPDKLEAKREADRRYARARRARLKQEKEKGP